MDFARKQLEKYGWSEGKGLGKDEDGIKNAIKAKPKNGLAGIGHKLGDEFTDHWWQKAYNEAANNVQDFVSENGKIQIVSSNSPTKTKKNQSSSLNKVTKRKRNKAARLEYAEKFVMGATLTNGVVESASVSTEDAPVEEDSESKLTIVSCTDEELYAACGGRTAHKGARHGLKSNGKLSRIEKQETLLMKNYQCAKSKR